MLKYYPRGMSPTCHPERMVYAKGLCRSCYEKDLRATNPAFAERQRKNCRKWVSMHIEKQRAYNRAYQAKRDPEVRRAHALRIYGLTPATYAKLCTQQDGCCAICGRRAYTKRLAVDHDHVTGHIRGLLCSQCNVGLAWFKENADLLRRAAAHVETRIDLEKLYEGL